MKTKVRLTALDIGALVVELKQRIIGSRLTNIYNVDQKEYVFKFSLQENKNYLVIENGVRFNLSSEAVEKSKVPSCFTMKFRKVLRSRRLEQIEQIGVERVVMFTFGKEDHANYLILELYAQGNIILTDKDFRVIQLTRQHVFSETAKVAPNEIYPFEQTCQNYFEKFDTSIETIQKIIATKTFKFKELLFKIVPCLHTALNDDLIVQCGFNPNEKITNQIEQVKKVVEFAMEYIAKFRAQTEYKGYLIAKEETPNQKFIEFTPDLAQYHQKYFVKELTSFNEAVSDYYKQLDRTEDNKPTIEELAWKKFENIKQDQDGRIKKLQQEQDEYLTKARLIEENIDDVQNVIYILETMYKEGIAWDKIGRMINESKKEGNPLANIIGKMDLEHHKIQVLLGEKDDLYSELMAIDIDITLSAYQNARKYFESKKKNNFKEQKTKEAASLVLKQAEKTALKEIEREKNKVEKVQANRKKYWFEKFNWFLSTDGYLVISGRDVQQNELIVKKYLNKDDLFMHADMYGSTSTVIKNPQAVQVIPDSTLMQAATATICRSKAWDSKIVVPAYWVYANQVSKAAPTGQSMPAGSFMIYGQKNFIQPPRLEMGCTLLYQLDQESVKKHEAQRIKKFQEQENFSKAEQQQQKQAEQVANSDDDSDDEPQVEQTKAKPKLTQQKQVADKEPKEQDLEKDSDDSDGEQVEVQEEPIQVDDGLTEEQIQQEQIAEYSEMQKLVTYLFADDKYLSLIPMCAPYTVIANNKFKIKILPGAVKKGRAAKDVLNFFLQMKDNTKLEQQNIRVINDDEVVQTMPSGVKLSGAGMLQLKQKEKAQKKKEHKEQNKKNKK